MPVTRYKSLFVGAVCCASLTLALAASVSACEPDPGRQPIRVSVGDDGNPAVTPDSVHACVGETIRWVFEGPAREFAVDFTSADKSPFSWAKLTGATVEGTIKSGAAKGGKSTSYSYDVSFGSQSSDPKIIVDP
jgi:plastocyanin